MNKMMLIIDEPKDCYYCPIHKTQFDEILKGGSNGI